MIQIRKSHDRGDANHGWLKSQHTFSFADYYEPKHMGFSVLRVINEDRIEGGTGFGTHGHRDMEIISYVVEGALEHKDSMGNQTIIKPGEVQRMSAGTGIQHSEYNHIKEKTSHFLQIWVLPEKMGIAPSYEQKSFESDFSSNELILVCSRNGRDGSLSINQDVDMYVAKSKIEGEKTLKTSPTRHYWLQVISGDVMANESILAPGDGAGITGLEELKIKWSKNSEFILFDLP